MRIMYCISESLNLTSIVHDERGDSDVQSAVQVAWLVNGKCRNVRRPIRPAAWALCELVAFFLILIVTLDDDDNDFSLCISQ